MQLVKVATLTRSVTDNNEWFGIIGVLVTYENVLYVSTVSVTPQQGVETRDVEFIMSVCDRREN